MKIYDISQEVFGCVVFPGDPAPAREILAKISEGSPYNLTAFSMCAHNGTHVDAPYHFIGTGKGIDELSLTSLVGYAFVAECSGKVTADDALLILEKAKMISDECAKRILIKGDAWLSPEAARVFADSGLLLYGNESQTVGPMDSPMPQHLILLGADTVLLEGVRLGEVSEGEYFLSAAPISLGGADGAPCRAILIKF